VRYRVGLIVPSSNTTMETEVPSLLAARSRVCPADTFSFHGSRARMQQVSTEELRAMNDQVGRCALELGDARPDILATACLVAVMAQGRGYHRVAEAEITEIARRQGLEIPVISSAGALVNALAALGARRVAMVAPYMESLTALVVDYLEGEGIAVADRVSLCVDDNVAVGRLDPADLQEHWKRLDLAGCDALVLSACVQMPSLPAVEPVEQAAGLPVVTAATATAWSILDTLGLAPVAPGGGHLLGGTVATTRAERPSAVGEHGNRYWYGSTRELPVSST
jgi:maleate isomerase